MKKVPLISIITVVYNSCNLIRETIESVYSQNLDRDLFEYIIIDGGSTDGTLEIVRDSIRSADSWISESDDGIYDAMNKGLSLANGEWVTFLNAGDLYFDNDVLAKVSRSFGVSDIVYGKYIKNYKSGPREIVPAVSISKLTLLFSMGINHQTLFIKRSLIDRFNTRYRIAADFDLLLRVLENKDLSITYVDTTIVQYDPYGFSSGSLVEDEFAIILRQHYGRIISFLYMIKVSFKRMLKAFYKFIMHNCINRYRRNI
jgi:glycosyltransferase involved in cell wall biosynthesis